MWLIGNNIMSLPNADFYVAIRARYHQVSNLLFSDYNGYHYPLNPIPDWIFEDQSGTMSLQEWQTLGLDKNSQTLDPQFIDTDSGNLKLNADSPYKGNGNPDLSPWCRIDADGTPRSSMPSVGAF